MVSLVILNIGIDDTDSKKGMCTTYVGAVIIRRIREIGGRLEGFPKLIRLNPMWPHKTRGNCAVAMKVRISRQRIPIVKRIVLDTVRELAELRSETTNPGVVFYESEDIPKCLKTFSKKTVQEVVDLKEAEELAKEVEAEIHKFKLGNGVIGALAAIGHPLDRDWTFELIAYRIRENWGTPRKIDAESVFRMNAETYPETFDNLDPLTGEIRITPHTPCPILYGIRGETPEAVEKASKLVRTLEPVDFMITYKTNQGTDEHYLRLKKISEVKPYRSVIVDGTVCRAPRTIPGGHVIFSVKNGSGEIDCAAYEPTRKFREIARSLVIGDKVRVFGGVKEKPNLPLTVNLEKISILKLVPLVEKRNPTCPRCGRRMKSEGKGKGYSCKKCKINAPEGKAETIRLPRKILLRIFEVPPRCRRHLAKPLVREVHVAHESREI